MERHALSNFGGGRQGAALVCRRMRKMKSRLVGRPVVGWGALPYIVIALAVPREPAAARCQLIPYEPAEAPHAARRTRNGLCRATTLAGLKVKVLAVAWCQCDTAAGFDPAGEEWDGATDDRISGSIMRDLLAA